MIGAIAGDIIGSVYEEFPIRSKEFPLFNPDCRFTDDTVLITKRQAYVAIFKKLS